MMPTLRSDDLLPGPPPRLPLRRPVAQTLDKLRQVAAAARHRYTCRRRVHSRPPAQSISAPAPEPPLGATRPLLPEANLDTKFALLGLPLLDVEINLHVERNEHRDRKVEPNDEIDLGFLSLAVPYCHVVITEKFWASVVCRLKLDQKYGTFIGCDLNEILRLGLAGE